MNGIHPFTSYESFGVASVNAILYSGTPRFDSAFGAFVYELSPTTVLSIITTLKGRLSSTSCEGQLRMISSESPIRR